MGDTGRRQSLREPPPCPRRGSDHLGVGVEQLKQGHDQGLHGDATAAVLVQIVGHGGAFLLVQQVPGLLLQQQARLVPQAAQGHLGAGWPLVESRLKDRKTGVREFRRALGSRGGAMPGTTVWGRGSPLWPWSVLCTCRGAWVRFQTVRPCAFAKGFTPSTAAFTCPLHSSRNCLELSGLIMVSDLFSRFQGLPW